MCDVEIDLLVCQNDLLMNWNWVVGYFFVCIDGMVDLDGDGILEMVMEYYLGKDDFFCNVSLMLYIDVEQDQ